MKRGRAFTATLLAILFTGSTLQDAAAQETDDLTAEKFSLGSGVGFFADSDSQGFTLDFEGTYHINEHWSSGVNFLLGFDHNFLLFSMPLYLQYEFGKFPVDVAVLKDMNAFLRFGLGFTYARLDNSSVDLDRTGFLFVLGGGVAYPLTEHFSLESRMNLNLTSNDFFDDDFYYSWQILGARYRF